MTFDAIVEEIKKQAANVAPFGARLKFVIDGNPILIDGTAGGNEVSTVDADADCTISTDTDSFVQLKDGSLNPMMAVMGGKVKIQGDMGLAMKLQSLI